jgi:hypothetical protein
MTQYEWHLAKAADLHRKAMLCLSVVDKLDDRLNNKMYGVWTNHANDLVVQSSWHEEVCAQLTIEQANEELGYV